jgi:hypothetical protein
MTRMVLDAPLNSTFRRAMNAARMVSPRRGVVAMTWRSAARGTAMTSPGSATRAETNTRCPVRRLSSPRNLPAPCWAIVRSSPSAPMTMSTDPETTTKKS